jgi:hypothetical protein
MEKREREKAGYSIDEEHVKEFEGLSKTTTMRASAVVTVVLVSREYPMIALRL